jgi:hypothetical protein
MRTWADRLISVAYADLILQVLEINAKPMRCKEISKEISEHSDFPELSPQYVRRQMGRMVSEGEIVRLEEPVPYSTHKTIYFVLPAYAEVPEAEDEDEVEWDWEMKLEDKPLIEGIAGGHKAFAITEDGKITKLF